MARLGQGLIGTDNSELERAALLIERARRFAEEVSGLRGEMHRAQVSEALTRNQLARALTEALAARDDARDQLAQDIARRHRAAAQARRRPRRLNRPAKLVDRVLAKLAGPGQALVGYRARRGAAVDLESLFDADWYLGRNPDAGRNGLAPFIHYLVAGGFERRSPHPLFDDRHYAEVYAHDLAATGLTPLEHYARLGAALGYNPHPLFDAVWYLAQDPDFAETGGDPLTHYLTVGAAKGLSPHPLFSPAFYDRQRGEDRSQPGLLHYLTVGSQAGMKPHPLFDPAWYRETYPDVVAAGEEPFTHFAAWGGRDRRNPSPWFDSAHYAAARGPAMTRENPLADYLTGGAWRVGEACPGFPTAAYLTAHPEFPGHGLTPLEHWALRGEG